MKTCICKSLLMAISLGAVALPARAATEYFADAKNGNDAYDGLAEVWNGTHGPKKTVQAAVDVAQVGSTKANRNTVTLLPGDYAEGLTAVTQDNVTTSNRVVISAPLLLRSKNGRASRDTTRLIGAWDTSGASDTKGYMGPRAVRCVWVHEAAVSGTRLEGLTFLRGAAAWGGDGADHSQTTGGGGVLFDIYASKDGLVVDCAFIECIGTRGGGLFNGTAVRCLFTLCRASKYGCAARQCNAYNCVFADNLRCREVYEDGCTWTFSYPYNVVNCTFVGNDSGGVNARTASSVQPLWNCIFFRNVNGEASSDFAPTNCVSDAGQTAGRAAAIEKEIFSPATGDYRLTEGAAATTAGNMEWLAKIPEEFRDTDYYGNPRTTGGRVYAGAVQATAKPAGGAYELSTQSHIDRVGLVSCNDHVCIRPLYEQGETWPRSVKFAWTPGLLSGTTNLIRFCDNTWANASAIWPLTNNTAWAVSPKESVKTIYFQFGPNLYVDPVSGSDETGDGSREKPWRTIQKAVDGRSKSGTRAVINALPGDYNEGATYYLGCSNRIYVTSSEPLRILATEGPSKTFITGAPDQTTPLDKLGWGIGSNAVRCVAADKYANCAFQGFTLRGGRGSQNVENKDCDAGRGAGFLNGVGTKNYQSCSLLDCVVTDCRGSRGPAAYGGICERTVFTDCAAHGYCTFRYCELRSCVVTNMSSTTGGAQLGDISYAYNTTFYGNGSTAINNANAYNCVMSGNSADISVTPERSYVDSLFTKIITSTQPGNGSVIANAYFADAAGNDLRLVSGSAATWLGDAAHLKSAMDFTGRPFTFNAEGRMRAGAFDELVPGVRVEKVVSVLGETEVRRVPEEGLTVTGTAFAGRDCLALVVNGVTQEVGVVSHTVSPAEAMSVVPYVVSCVYPTRFFVDAAGGSDENKGVSEAQAWKTLAHASTNAVYAGDHVTVLPGTYDEGEVFVRYTYTLMDNTSIGTRVQVFPGVTFESRDGADSTIVLGSCGTGTVETVNIDTNGCGPGAVKCAFVCDNAVLRGFTLRGGRCDTGWISIYGNKDRQTSANMGAGAFGGFASGTGCFETFATRRVENCIIDDCFAPRGGAARYVGLFNCTITGCGGNNFGASVRDTVLNGCVIAKTLRSGSEQYYNNAFDSCTILADNAAFSINHDTAVFPNGIPIVNCAFCRPSSWLNGLVYSNCAFAAGTTFQRAAEAGFINENALTGIADFGLDAQGRPAKTSPLVDAGNKAILPPWSGGTTDLAGTPRVLNGALDIGAFEYDWRTDFSKALAKRRLDVTEVTPEATLSGNALVWADGTLALDWARGNVDAPYAFTLTVGEGASLVVTLNGETLGTYGAGTETVRFTSPEILNQLKFIAQGEAAVSAFDHRFGSLILLR